MRRTRPILFAVALTLLVVPPLAGADDDDGQPCFAQLAVDTLLLERSESGILLSWQVPPSSVAWYEVTRCTGEPAACELLSLAPVTETHFEDVAVPPSSYVGYKVAAIVDPDDNGCSNRTYCWLPTGKCGGSGTCSLHAELCEPLPFDPVCGCDGQTYSNSCTASAAGANVRHSGACVD